jgi:hypothetical protein
VNDTPPQYPSSSSWTVAATTRQKAMQRGNNSAAGIVQPET